MSHRSQVLQISQSFKIFSLPQSFFWQIFSKFVELYFLGEPSNFVVTYKELQDEK